MVPECPFCTGKLNRATTGEATPEQRASHIRHIAGRQSKVLRRRTDGRDGRRTRGGGFLAELAGRREASVRVNAIVGPSGASR